MLAFLRHLAAGCGWSGGSIVVESGSHQDSLQMLLSRTIDATAIDSTVLEMAFAREPWIIEKVRTMAVFGPSPAPPWVVHHSVPYEMQEVLRREFLSIHTRQDGQRMLEAAGISRFVSVSDENYDPIREVDRVAATVVSGEMKALALCC